MVVMWLLLLSAIALAVALAVAILFGSAVVWFLRGRRRRTELRELSLQLGLTLQAGGTRLVGQDGEVAFSLRVDTNGEGLLQARGLPRGLKFGPESIATRLKGLDLQIGEPAFDDVVRMEGRALELCSVLDASNRARILALVKRGGHVADGDLEVVFHPGELTTVEVQPMLDLARSLARPVGASARLLEVVRSEPAGSPRGVLMRTLLAGSEANHVEAARPIAQEWPAADRAVAGLSITEEDAWTLLDSEGLPREAAIEVLSRQGGPGSVERLLRLRDAKVAGASAAIAAIQSRIGAAGGRLSVADQAGGGELSVAADAGRVSVAQAAPDTAQK